MVWGRNQTDPWAKRRSWSSDSLRRNPSPRSRVVSGSYIGKHGDLSINPPNIGTWKRSDVHFLPDAREEFAIDKNSECYHVSNQQFVRENLWKLDRNRLQYMDWLSKQLGVEHLSDWWDHHIDSVRATIHQVRRDLVPEKGPGEPIPLLPVKFGTRKRMRSWTFKSRSSIHGC